MPPHSIFIRFNPIFEKVNLPSQLVDGGVLVGGAAFRGMRLCGCELGAAPYASGTLIVDLAGTGVAPAVCSSRLTAVVSLTPTNSPTKSAKPTRSRQGCC